MLFLTVPKSAFAGWVTTTCRDISTSANGSDWSASGGYINFNTGTCQAGYPGSSVPRLNLSVFFNRALPNVYFRSISTYPTTTELVGTIVSESVSGGASYSAVGSDRNYIVSVPGSYNYSLELSKGFRLSYTITFTGSNSNASITYSNISIGVNDTVAPSLSSLDRDTPSSVQTEADTLRWKVKFDEDVVNVDASDFSLSGTSATLSVSGSGDTYYVTASGGDLASLTGQVTLSLAGANNIQDQGANALNTSSTSSSYSVDNTTLVTNVSSSAADRYYRTGTIPIAIEFQRAVTVVGSPQLLLETGSVDSIATYTSGSGTSTLVFSYAVSSGDIASDLAYNSTTALTLNGGSLADTNSLAPILTLASPGASGSLSANSEIIIDTTSPIVTGANINLAGATGTGSTFKVGDTVTVSWDTSGGDGDTNITSTLGGVTVDFSAFGGANNVAATLSGTTWTATYTIVANTSTSGSNLNVSVTATDEAGNATTAADTSNATVDANPPVVSAANISLSGATGTGGTFKIGDTATATWDDTASGDNNGDIASVSVDFTEFGGGAAVVASNNSGTWTATYAITNGSIDLTNRNVLVTAIDAAGNSSNQTGVNNVIVDNINPTVVDGDITVSGGTGPSSAFKVGDTVTIAWTANNTDTVATVEVDFSAFGGPAAATATESSGVWTATYLLPEGSLSSSSLQMSVTAYDDAGNDLSTTKATVYTANTFVPTVVVTGPTEIVTEQFTVNIEFSEAVSSDLVASEIRVENGTVASVAAASGSSTQFTAAIDPVLGNTVLVQVLANAVTNTAGGNPNAVSNEFTVFAGSVATAFEEYREEIRQVVVDEVERSLRSGLSANQRMVRGARGRFVAAQQEQAECSEDNTGAGNAATCDVGLVSRNNVPFDVDGSFTLSENGLSTSGSFFEQTGNYEGTQRRLFFGDFDVQHDGNTDSTTATLTGRMAWEQMYGDKTMLGYFIGGELAHSNIKGSFEGEQDRLGLSFGGYAVHQLDDQIFLDGFITLGAGRNDLEMANDVLALTSDYTTRTATVGAALSGVYEYEQYEFRPELAFSYGKTWIGDVGFTGVAYGLTDNTLSLDAGNVSITNLTLRPEVVWALDADTVADSRTQLTYAPRLICERVQSTTTTQDCGTGGELGLTSTSRDGMSNAEFRVIVDKVGDSTRSSLMLNFERQF